ncbi:hypothetical protein C5167_044689 [Papaver somniferum]|nr:hypothetical protein C5167_044689 [Papaver somniferum]
MDMLAGLNLIKKKKKKVWWFSLLASGIHHFGGNHIESNAAFMSWKLLMSELATMAADSPTLFSSSPNSTLDHAGHHGLSAPAIVGIVVAVVLVICVVVAVFCYFQRRKKKRLEMLVRTGKGMQTLEASRQLANRMQPTEAGNAVRQPTIQLHNTEAGNCSSRVEGEFSFGFLQEVTQNFSEQNLLGEGAFGKVYRGKFPDGTEVAVERLNLILDVAGLMAFQAELSILKMTHRHLVSVIGFCNQGVEHLIVYEFMESGTLHQKLFEWIDTRGNPMSWDERIVVALDVAKGLHYLHSLSREAFVHRDVKCKNILLDRDMRAKISDYGLVKAMTDDEKSVVTKLAGTRGYLAPEYAMTGHLSIKADVYTFGIVLLELITGQTTVDDGQAGKNLAMRFRPVYKRGMENVRALVDRALMEAVRLAMECTRTDPWDRPGFAEITARLGLVAERWPQRAEEEEEEEEEAAFDRERFLRDLGNDGEGTTAYYSVWDLEQGQSEETEINQQFTWRA